MADSVDGVCKRCTRVRKLHNGYCDECAGIVASKNGGSLFGSSFSSRCKCPRCEGTGVIRHILDPDEKCSDCEGTGYQ